MKRHKSEICDPTGLGESRDLQRMIPSHAFELTPLQRGSIRPDAINGGRLSGPAGADANGRNWRSPAGPLILNGTILRAISPVRHSYGSRPLVAVPQPRRRSQKRAAAIPPRHASSPIARPPRVPALRRRAEGGSVRDEVGSEVSRCNLIGQLTSSTTPPSTRRTAPVVAEACGEQR